MNGISIIIPCFNSEKYIRRCLDSIKPGKSDVEVIVVDDCSTDNTVEIVHQYSNRLNIVVTLSKYNRGPGISRNIGIGNATKKYIMFVDSDDTLSDDFFDSVQPYLNKNYDCVIFDALRVFRNKGMYLPMFLSGKRIVKEGMVSPKMAFVYMRASVYGKLYKRSLVVNNEIQFTESKKGEEYAFTKPVLSKCEKIYYIPKPMYCYYDTPGSLIHQNIKDDDKLRFGIYREVSSKINPVDYKDELEAIYYFLVVMPLMINSFSDNVQLEEIRNRYNNLMDGHGERNKYDRGYMWRFRIFFFALRHRMFMTIKFLLICRDIFHKWRSR